MNLRILLRLSILVLCAVVVSQILLIAALRDQHKRALATIGELMATGGKFYRDEFGRWQPADNYWKEAQK